MAQLSLYQDMPDELERLECRVGCSGHGEYSCFVDKAKC